MDPPALGPRGRHLPLSARPSLVGQVCPPATAWQGHSVRRFISGSIVKKMGLKVESNKRPDGERAYSLAQKHSQAGRPA